jgi:hypothetical protein
MDFFTAYINDSRENLEDAVEWLAERGRELPADVLRVLAVNADCPRFNAMLDHVAEHGADLLYEWAGSHKGSGPEFIGEILTEMDDADLLRFVESDTGGLGKHIDTAGLDAVVEAIAAGPGLEELEEALARYRKWRAV